MSDLLDDVTAAAGLMVFGAASVAGVIDARPVPGWEPDPEVVPRVLTLRAELRAAGLDHVVLTGTGSAPAEAAAIARTLGVDLTVLDSVDPHQIRAALADRLPRTVVVVTGDGLEPDTHRRAYLQAFEDAGVQDPGRRFVFVAPPGSPGATTALEMGAQLFPAGPGPLPAAALVPAGLAGADIGDLLDQATALSAPTRPTFTAGFSVAPPTVVAAAPSTESPALALGAALAAAAAAGRDKLALAADGSGIVGLGEWIAQLVAGPIVPVVLETPSSWGHEGADVLSVTTGGVLVPGVMPGGGIAPDLAVNGPLGAQLLAWEQAIALAGLAAPPGADSHEHIHHILDAGLPPEPPAFVEGAIEVHGPVEATTVIGALDEFAQAVPPGGHLAIHAHLDRNGDAAAAGTRAALAGRVDRAVTFGWAPGTAARPAGCVLQLTGAATEDLRVPGRPYTFGELQAAQAAGDRQALRAQGHPLLRLHLTDRTAGIHQLLAALGG